MANAATPTRHRIRKVILVVLALALVYPTGSYIRELSYPGRSDIATTTVDWLRGMGAGAMVDAVENWWYISKVPSQGPPPANALPSAAPAVARAPLPVQPGMNRLPGEGIWRAPSGPALLTTYERPDPAHHSVVAAVVRFDQRYTTLELHSGTKEPAKGAGKVPTAELPRLLATFNSGFLMMDADGGWYADGKIERPLRTGAASLVINQHGTANVTAWDGRLTPNIVAVRQNLDLVVDNGKPVPGLAENPGARWGNARSQLQYTWRSGIGVDSAGQLSYVAGNQLTLSTLADAMRDAGIIRGMQLDIHASMVNFNIYGPHGPTKLLPTMQSPVTRYLTPDQRDFFTATTKPGTTKK